MFSCLWLVTKGDRFCVDSLCVRPFWLSGVVKVMGRAFRGAWLGLAYKKSDSWLSLSSFVLVTGSWLCLDLCLVIGGVPLLAFGGFLLVRLLVSLLDIAVGGARPFSRRSGSLLPLR